MKLKYYLRGLGTGILFATVVLIIAYSYKMSDGQIKERAKELGMVYAENTTVNKNTEENTDNISNPTKNEDTTKEETTSLETTSSETTTQSETTTEEITTQPETTSQVLDERYTYQLTVTSRTTSMDVSRKLEDAGIIENANDFNDFLCDNKYAEIIQNGKFTVIKGMTYEQIARIITGSKE